MGRNWRLRRPTERQSRKDLFLIMEAKPAAPAPNRTGSSEKGQRHPDCNRMSEFKARTPRYEMKNTPKSIYEDEVRPAEAAHHVAGARHLLTELHKKLRQVEDYPELQEAITKLEVALSMLTVKTGGML